jgi:predicted RNA-binding protein YlqC (UPF0109 family)
MTRVVGTVHSFMPPCVTAPGDTGRVITRIGEVLDAISTA